MEYLLLIEFEVRITKRASPENRPIIARVLFVRHNKDRTKQKTKQQWNTIPKSKHRQHNHYNSRSDQINSRKTCSVQEMQRVDRELSLELTESPVNPTFIYICLPSIRACDPFCLLGNQWRASLSMERT